MKDNEEIIQEGLKRLYEEPQTESWISELENEFGFWKDITITPRQAGDVARADLIQTYYRNTGERLKDFIGSLLSKTRQEAETTCAINCARHEMEARLEERQRVVRIAEEMRIAKVAKNTESNISIKRGAYNKGLSDLSSRVLEEGKE